jgi:hypothetical protein
MYYAATKDVFHERFSEFSTARFELFNGLENITSDQEYKVWEDQIYGLQLYSFYFIRNFLFFRKNNFCKLMMNLEKEGIPLNFQNYFHVKGADVKEFFKNLNIAVLQPMKEKAHKYGYLIIDSERFYSQWAFHEFIVRHSSFIIL